jgi:hypothetical protein
MIIVVLVNFPEMPIGIAADDFLPEFLRRLVFLNLILFLVPWKLVKYPPRGKFSNTVFTVFSQDEELGYEIHFFRWINQTGSIEPNQGEPGDLVIHTDEERVAVRLGPVKGEIFVRIQTILVHILIVELGEIVLVKLHEPFEDGFFFEGGRIEGDVHGFYGAKLYLGETSCKLALLVPLQRPDNGADHPGL